jgi:hypothetical protein
MTTRIGLMSALLCWTLTAWGQPSWPTPNQVQENTEQFAYDRLADGRRLLFGPYPPRVAPVPPAQTCAELYAERVQLMRAQVDYKPAYTDDPRNRAAVFIGTLFTPGFYYLAFTGVQAYLDATDDASAQSRLDALRYASAEQQCYTD